MKFRTVLITTMLIFTSFNLFSQRHQSTINGGLMSVIKNDQLYLENYKFDFGYNYIIGDKYTQFILNPSIGYFESNTKNKYRNNFIAFGASIGSLYQVEAGVKVYYLFQNREIAYSGIAKLYFTDQTENRLNVGLIGELGNLGSQGIFFMPSLVITINLKQ